MSLDEILPDINRLEADGAVIVLKWDGERSSDKKTVVVSKPGTDYLFRKDSDDLASAVKQGIADYDQHFRKN